MVVVPNPEAGRRKAGGVLDAIPLLLIPLIVYNVAAWGGRLISGADNIREGLTTGFDIAMPATEAIWTITVGDIFVWISLILLFIEILRATSIGGAAIVNHVMSVLIFIVCLAEFLLFPPFATSVFFAIMLMTLLDSIAGFVISIITARRDFAING